ncbi:MAG: nucleotide sugar dehydrogenase, partial [Terracoccus sp.]
MKITVVGLGYVGLSNAIILAGGADVVALELDPDRVALVNAGRSPIVDADIEERLALGEIALTATTDAAAAYDGAEFVVVATPTDYDPDTNFFDTSSVETVIAAALDAVPDTTVVIRSTIPVGFTERMRAQFPTGRILFAPEFLREGRALWDNLHPSRIVVGGKSDEAREFARLLVEGSDDPDVPVLFTESAEAEAIKLFANTYLAMRVAYFNELDSFALSHGLDSRHIIDGVGLDPRIGT